MTDNQQKIPEKQAQSLIDEIETSTHAKAERYVKIAEQKARQILKRSHKTARARLREVVERLRKDRELALIQQNARLKLEQHQGEQNEASRILDMGCQRLEQSLRDRWQDLEARKHWIDASIHLAALSLNEANWTIRGPATLPPNEADRIMRVASKKTGTEVHWLADENIEAGLKIASNGALLDSTPRGLLADGMSVKAGLLAELGKIKSRTKVL